MCGIVGYIGEKDALPYLIGGLHRLEYRGYDSAGVVTIENGKASLYRAKGKVADLEKSIGKKASAVRADCAFADVINRRWII